MTTIDDSSALHVPARDIPIPSTVSPEAAANLALRSMVGQSSNGDFDFSDLSAFPSDLSDKEAVAALLAVWDQAWASNPESPAATNFGVAAVDISDVHVEHAKFGDVSVYIATPEGVTDADRRVYMTIHGSWIQAGGEVSRVGAAQTAKALGVRTWAVDYRMPPFHPYPTPLNDSVDAYKAILERYQPGNVAIGGTSGGGNLALALLLRAHSEGLPMPAAAVINTPYVDLAHVGDTFKTMEGIDIDVTVLGIFTRPLYLDGHDPLDPYVSPILGTYTSDFPPIMLTTGTRDFLLSDTVRLHRKLLASGVEAELHVWEAAQHIFFGGLAPEDLERPAQARRFLDARWATPPVAAESAVGV
ncbi:alpha/beta hydrolase fold domain-containing protein [Arthrobacter sp. ES3-54]|jgi:epsilon-lactone hydrolase|uniref:alpha/beta hydrolase fold domain-containing protein n=1 Tax=Arthrobacter sp. ES3-54 TaxID=1502991 RepID=UPI0024074C90|nr:alpha/beta hydrolase fold domain-containing protein [Arthrobacter sp. ES3-54]MDF9749596.1 monoterpene epsilon-lactone hydrolase [Arthrobacter sp. ES3-54]